MGAPASSEAADSMPQCPSCLLAHNRDGGCGFLPGARLLRSGLQQPPTRRSPAASDSAMITSNTASLPTQGWRWRHIVVGPCMHVLTASSDVLMQPCSTCGGRMLMQQPSLLMPWCLPPVPAPCHVSAHYSGRARAACLLPLAPAPTRSRIPTHSSAAGSQRAAAHSASNSPPPPIHTALPTLAARRVQAGLALQVSPSPLPCNPTLFQHPPAHTHTHKLFPPT